MSYLNLANYDWGNVCKQSLAFTERYSSWCSRVNTDSDQSADRNVDLFLVYISTKTLKVDKLCVFFKTGKSKIELVLCFLSVYVSQQDWRSDESSLRRREG